MAGEARDVLGVALDKMLLDSKGADERAALPHFILVRHNLARRVVGEALDLSRHLLGHVHEEKVEQREHGDRRRKQRPRRGGDKEEPSERREEHLEEVVLVKCQVKVHHLKVRCVSGHCTPRWRRLVPRHGRAHDAAQRVVVQMARSLDGAVDKNH